MKVKFLLFTLALGTLVACDPLVDDSKLDITTFGSVDEMMEGAYIKQYSDAEGTKESNTGKYVEYSVPNVSSVAVSYTNASGVSKDLEHGKNYGIVYVKIVSENATAPITFNLTYVDVTGAETVYTQDITVETTLMTAEEILLVGTTQSKTWTWDTKSPVGCCWGNGGFRAGAFETIYSENPGKWWGLNSTEEFADQTQHINSNDTFETSGGDINAYMVISMDDGITCYNANDEVIRSGGSWEITDWDETGESNRGFYQGFLETSAGAILWPYAINLGGYEPTKFEIVKLTEDKLMLCYPDGTDSNGVDRNGDFSEDADWCWAEMTFWYFTAVPNAEEYMKTTSEEEVRWTWASDEAVDNYASCWGNCGYGGGDSHANSVGGSWWGCGTDDFAGQFGDPNSDNPVLSDTELYDEGEGAYMIFDESGYLYKYNQDDQLVGSGKWDIDLEQLTDKGGFGTRTRGLLTTSGDGILLPYQINGGGSKADWFDIAYVNNSILLLINQRDDYFPDNWSEATWWRFESTRTSLSSGEDEGE